MKDSQFFIMLGEQSYSAFQTFWDPYLDKLSSPMNGLLHFDPELDDMREKRLHNTVYLQPCIHYLCPETDTKKSVKITHVYIEKSNSIHTSKQKKFG